MANLTKEPARLFRVLILLPALAWLLLPQKVFAKKPETSLFAQLVKER